MQTASINTSLVKQETAYPDAVGKQAVLKILLYFDIFHYPLSRTEIRQFLSIPASEISLAEWLAQLENEKKIFFFNGFYSVQDNALLSHRRIRGNERAAGLIAKGLKIGRFLYRFPFVKAIGISGSLSKGFADENADIDFFIITKANRLWLARTLMHLYKKLTFITGRQHYYCMNYYIDEKALTIEDKNIFSAIEIKTLLPVCGNDMFQQFYSANEWATEIFPACSFRKQSQRDPQATIWKKLVGWLFNQNKLDNFLMKVSQHRWNKKQERGKRNLKGLPMGMISSKHFSISNPGDFQEKVLQAYNEKLTLIELNVTGDSVAHRAL